MHHLSTIIYLASEDVQVAHKFAHKLWTPENAWRGPACSVHVLPFLSSCFFCTHALSIVALSLKLFKGAKFFPTSEFSYRFFPRCELLNPPHSFPTLLFPCWLPLHLNSKWDVTPLDFPKWNVISVLFWALPVPSFHSTSHPLQWYLYLHVYLFDDYSFH